MAIFKCTDCGGNVNTEAKSCPHCGATKPFKKQKLTVEQVKQISNKELRQFKNLGGDFEMSKAMKIGFVLLAVFIAFLILKPEKPLTPEEIAAKQEADEKAKTQSKIIDLASLCQVKINRQLNDPDSSDFGEYNVIPIGKDNYKVIQNVRAKNAFGAMIGGSFECKATYSDSDTSPNIYEIRQLK